MKQCVRYTDNKILSNVGSVLDGYVTTVLLEFSLFPNSFSVILGLFNLLQILALFASLFPHYEKCSF